MAQTKDETIISPVRKDSADSISSFGGGNAKSRLRNSPIKPSPPRVQSLSSDFDADNMNNDDNDMLDNAPPLPPRRGRINSRDIPRSHSGNYGDDHDMLPLEITRDYAWWESQERFLIFCYIMIVVITHIVISLIVSAEENYGVIGFLSFTWTNGIHFIVSVGYVHWLKGSTYDQQGEMQSMTLWEQMEAQGSATRELRMFLGLVPTGLTWCALQLSEFDIYVVIINMIFWSLTMLGKLPCMNGVRIAGINRTPGFDDDSSGNNGNGNTKSKAE